jgi:hypothetical protein
MNHNNLSSFGLPESLFLATQPSLITNCRFGGYKSQKKFQWHDSQGIGNLENCFKKVSTLPTFEKTGNRF